MGILAKILLTVISVIIVILCSLGVLFIYLLIEIKALVKKRKQLQKELTEEEIKLLELRRLITEFTTKVNEYIYVLSNKKELIQCKKCNCLTVPNNNNFQQNIK